MLNIPYIFLNDFKNPPKASEYTSLLVKYVLSGNSIVIVLDNWILCCVDMLFYYYCTGVTDHPLHHKDNLGAVPQTSLQFSLFRECY